MSFTSLTFVTFLVIVFTLYWSLPTKHGQNALILAASLFFYGWWDYRFCGLMVLASLIDYAGGLAIHATEQVKWRRFWLALCMVSNLTMLAFFKYFDFFAESLQATARSLGYEFDAITLRVVLPVGISFYTFQSMSYSIDIYRGQLQPSRSVIDYMAFVTFFPQLVAGPIERATALLPQIESDRRFHYESAVEGCRLILWGFFKKMVLADGLAVIVDRHYSAPTSFSGPVLAFATVCFAFQIYCDFSAYSDIALGTSRLFGITLMRNFAYPYFSQSLAEFWRRWHISLSTWFRDYLYIPLGGNRVSRLGQVRNLMATFLTSGLWHGASWNFVIWGGVHGAAMVPRTLSGSPQKYNPSEVPGGPGLIPSPKAAGRMLLTFIIICLAWVFFRARTLVDAGTILSRILTDAVSPQAYAPLVTLLTRDREVRAMALILAAFILVEWIQRAHPHALHLPRWPRWARWATYSLVFWTMFYWQPQQSSQFIYFQF